jgi:hypothetical protein
MAQWLCKHHVQESKWSAKKLSACCLDSQSLHFSTRLSKPQVWIRVNKKRNTKLRPHQRHCNAPVNNPSPSHILLSRQTSIWILFKTNQSYKAFHNIKNQPREGIRDFSEIWIPTLLTADFLKTVSKNSVPTSQETLCLRYNEEFVNVAYRNNFFLVSKSYPTNRLCGKIQNSFNIKVSGTYIAYC